MDHFEQMRSEQLQGLFHGFMKASQSALQDEENKKGNYKNLEFYKLERNHVMVIKSLRI